MHLQRTPATRSSTTLAKALREADAALRSAKLALAKALESTGAVNESPDDTSSAASTSSSATSVDSAPEAPRMDRLRATIRKTSEKLRRTPERVLDGARRLNRASVQDSTARRRIRLSENNPPAQPAWNVDEPSAKRLLSIVGDKLNDEELQLLRSEISRLENEYNNKFMGLWQDLSTSNARISICTRGNKVFHIKGAAFEAED
ncbi:unnamed protein product [Oikopleura dioica]|uniref:Uncharacterized protein n=1 Tax=Oikopleura dioica TaxID=34765 RepID=E4XMG2_OIKDI|nr:unnamed protein product [Oikopleura dioica]